MLLGKTLGPIQDTVDVNDFNISQHDDMLYVWVKNGKIVEHYPSELLSKILGIQLHQIWGINDDNNLQKEFSENELIFLFENYPELKNIVNDKTYKEHKNNIDEICKLSGEKLDIRPKSLLLKRDIWHGCLSKFNYDDIQYYCEVPCAERYADEKQRELEHRMGFSFSYVPSMSTLNKIEDQLNKTNLVVTKELLIQILNKK